MSAIQGNNFWDTSIIDIHYKDVERLLSVRTYSLDIIN